MQDFMKVSAATGFVIQGMGDLLVTVGNRAPSASAVEWLEHEASLFADRHRGCGTYLHFTSESGDFTLPDEQARSAMNRFVTRAGVKFSAAAVVVEQDGFLGSALRSVFSGVLLVSRVPTPTKIFANAFDARAWLHATVPKSSIPAAEILLAELAKMIEKQSLPQVAHQRPHSSSRA